MPSPNILTKTINCLVRPCGEFIFVKLEPLLTNFINVTMIKGVREKNVLSCVLNKWQVCMSDVIFCKKEKTCVSQKRKCSMKMDMSMYHFQCL